MVTRALTQPAQDYVIESARIFSERLGKPYDKKSYDIKSYILELSLFEDIELPFITGELTAMDDLGSFFEMNPMGTEQIEIVIKGVEKDYDTATLTLVMNMTSIQKRFKTADRTEIYVFELISPAGFRDEGIKISKSYSGKLDSIAGNILENYLGVEISRNYQLNPATQEKVKVIVPYISPLEASVWLLDRATNTRGVPFYVWQSIYEQRDVETIRIGSLDRMISGGSVWNENQPLIYSQAAVSEVALGNSLDQDLILKEFRINNFQDTVGLMEQGSIGSSFSNLDTYTGQSYTRHFDVKDLLKGAGFILMRGLGNLQNVIDEKQTLTYEGQTKKSHEWDHRYFNTLTSYGTYASVNSYHDDPREMDMMNKMNARAIKNLFQKNTVEIVANGSLFFKPMTTGATVGVGAGDMIRINYLRADTQAEEPQLDEILSGYYIIHRCRHLFSGTRHQVSATVSKIDKDSPIDPQVEDADMY